MRRLRLVFQCVSVSAVLLGILTSQSDCRGDEGVPLNSSQEKHVEEKGEGIAEAIKNVESASQALASQLLAASYSELKAKSDALQKIPQLPKELVSAALFTEDSKQRYKAMQVVYEFRNPLAGHVCTQALNDDSGDVVYLAILGVHGNARFLDQPELALARILRSSKVRTNWISNDLRDKQPVACDAALILNEIGFGSTGVVANVLRKVMDDPKYITPGLSDDQIEMVQISCAATLINQANDASAKSWFLKTLQNEESLVRDWAAYSVFDMAAVKDRQFLNKVKSALEQLAKSPDDMLNHAATSALAKIQE